VLEEQPSENSQVFKQDGRTAGQGAVSTGPEAVEVVEAISVTLAAEHLVQTVEVTVETIVDVVVPISMLVVPPVTYGTDVVSMLVVPSVTCEIVVATVDVVPPVTWVRVTGQTVVEVDSL